MVAFITSPIDTLLQGATRARAPGRTCTAVPTLPCKPNSRCDLRETKLAQNTRWGSRSRDPIGYEDGKNQFESKIVLKNVDPSGKITVIPLWNNFPGIRKCQTPLSRIYWDFHLDTPAPCKGYIVQKVTIKCSKTACPDGIQFAETTKTASYFEAWIVEKNEWIPKVRLAPIGSSYSDYSSLPFAYQTYGFFESTGEIRFYCENAADDPRPNPIGTGPIKKPVGRGSGVSVTACGATISSGELPGTLGVPRFWKHPSIESGKRSHKRAWECCHCKGNFKDESIATPNK